MNTLKIIECIRIYEKKGFIPSYLEIGTFSEKTLHSDVMAMFHTHTSMM